LLRNDAPQDTLVRGIVLEVTHDARHFDLMHCINQGGRGTSLAQDVANIRDFREGGAFAVQRLWNLDAEQALPAQFREGFTGEASFGVDRHRIGSGHIAGRSGARRQIALPRAGYSDTGYPVGLNCHI
jgi:hypothetical protein